MVKISNTKHIREQGPGIGKDRFNPNAKDDLDKAIIKSNQFIVGDRVVGRSTSKAFKGLKGRITFVHEDGKTGDVRLDSGANIGANFKNFRKINK